MRADVNGITIHYVQSGPPSAPPVILHHPLGTNLGFWDDLATALEHRYRVIRFDARGHGATSAPEGAYDFDTLQGDVIGLMDHLGVEKARFVGLSMGGMVGQYLGVDHPSRFHSLVISSTVSQTAAEARPIWQGRIESVARDGYTDQMVDTALSRWLAPATMSGRPDLVARFRSFLTSTPKAGYVGWCHAILGLAMTERLSAITLPTMVIAGEVDPAAPPAAAEVIAGRIPGARLVVIPGASHMLNVEAPQAFHDVVLPFLAKYGPPPA